MCLHAPSSFDVCDSTESVEVLQGIKFMPHKLVPLLCDWSVTFIAGYVPEVYPAQEKGRALWW